MRKSKGLGDTIEKITKATGIKKIVESLFDDCGCDQRKEKLNKFWSYKTECLEEAEFEYLKGFFAQLKNQVSREQQTELLKIYNRVFNQKKKGTNCAPCFKPIIKDLRILFKTYEG